MNRVAAFAAVLGLSVVSTAGAARSVPKFTDYPAKVVEGRRAPLRLSSGDDRMYRTRLRDAYESQEINFGGKYVLTLWGCGALCLMGAAIDTTSGTVVWLPFTLCCFDSVADADSNFEPVISHADSRLAVFTGLRNESGSMATWFYEIKNGRWVLRGSVSRATQ